MRKWSKKLLLGLKI